MKKTTTIYRLALGLFAALMAFTSIPDILLVPEAVTFMNHLGYPAYFTLFIGLAKILGVIAITVPGFPRIKEWAYAGLFFDLIGAWYSQIANGDPVGPSFFMALPLGLWALAYLYYRKMQSMTSANQNNH